MVQSVRAIRNRHLPSNSMFSDNIVFVLTRCIFVLAACLVG